MSPNVEVVAQRADRHQIGLRGQAVDLGRLRLSFRARESGSRHLFGGRAGTGDERLDLDQAPTFQGRTVGCIRPLAGVLGALQVFQIAHAGGKRVTQDDEIGPMKTSRSGRGRCAAHAGDRQHQGEQDGNSTNALRSRSACAHHHSKVWITWTGSS